jgi:hypothetical protein
MRKAQKSNLEATLGEIVARTATEIAQAVRQNIAEEVSRLVGNGTTPRRGSPLVRRRRVILCPVPGCGKPGGGPKWGWFCATHKDLPAAEKEKARAATRARPDQAPAKAPRKKK